MGGQVVLQPLVLGARRQPVGVPIVAVDAARAEVGVRPGGGQDVEPGPAGVQRVPHARIIPRRRPVQPAVVVHLVLAPEVAAAWPSARSRPGTRLVEPVVPNDGEERDRGVRRRSRSWTEHRADIGSGLLEIAVLGLAPARIGDIAGQHREPRATPGELATDVRLVGVGGAHIGLAPIPEHGERERSARARRRLGGEDRGRVAAEEVGGAEQDPVAVLRVRRDRDGGLPLVLGLESTVMAVVVAGIWLAPQSPTGPQVTLPLALDRSVAQLTVTDDWIESVRYGYRVSDGLAAAAASPTTSGTIAASIATTTSAPVASRAMSSRTRDVNCSRARRADECNPSMSLAGPHRGADVPSVCPRAGDGTCQLPLYSPAQERAGPQGRTTRSSRCTTSRGTPSDRSPLRRPAMSEAGADGDPHQALGEHRAVGVGDLDRVVGVEGALDPHHPGRQQRHAAARRARAGRPASTTTRARRADGEGDPELAGRQARGRGAAPRCRRRRSPATASASTSGRGRPRR